MKKNLALELIHQQKDLLRENNLDIDFWSRETEEILLRIFPISGSTKISYFDLGEMPDFFHGYPEETKLEFFRNMAITHLISFMKEIETQGLEEYASRVAM